MAIENVCILDAGGQFTKVIDRRLRELNIYSEILPTTVSIEKLSAYKAIVISGGPSSVTDPGAPQLSPKIFELDIPILGICWGMQFITNVFGGEVKALDKREDGVFEIDLVEKSRLFENMDQKQEVLLTHGDSIVSLPEELKVIAKSGDIITGWDEGKSPFVRNMKILPRKSD